MKKTICLVCAVLLLFCGCSKRDESSQIDVGTFSYADDRAYYLDDPGVKDSGFINVEKSEVNDAAQAVELAKKECTVEYNAISVDFDADLKIYRVVFFSLKYAGGGQTVYVDQNGITLLIVYGE